MSYLNENNFFRVQYNPVKDVYSFLNSSLAGWKNGAFSSKNIQYKQENDWKMCYLARNGYEPSFIEWVFDLSVSTKLLTKISLLLESKCFENGCIDWTIFWSESGEFSSNANNLILNSDNACNTPFKILKLNGRYELTNFLTSKLVSFKIRADLSLGKAENAWQHTQLFRQSLNDSEINSMEICFYFSD